MRNYLLLGAALLTAGVALAQNPPGGEIHGNFEANSQFYNADSSIGAAAVPEKVSLNSFTNLVYTNNNFNAGVRFESFLNPLQGYDARYSGSGFPFKYASYSIDGLEVTAGNYYEQFGSGLIFRSYEEKGLGIDNAMEGVRVKYKGISGVQLKGIWGTQRNYWSKGPGIVRGADGEFAFNEMFKKLADKDLRVTLGASAISKYQKDNDPVYNLPQNVAAFAGRLNVSRKKVSLYSEYAYKINDPSYVNNFIYKDGSALLVNMEYASKGIGVNIGAKRIDNMNFRSDLNATVNDLTLSYLPALTKQHTYALATIYPYGVQANGEFGFQGELIYTLKKNSALGGKYGTTVSFNYSRANAIERHAAPDTNVIGAPGTLGYSSSFLEMGKEVYFEDFNIEISKKFSSTFKMNLAYIYLLYNKDVIQGTPGYGTIYSHIGVSEMFFKLSSKTQLRTELQHLYTEQDQESWMMGLAEFTVAPNWFVAALDQYNYGNPVTSKAIHYYNFQVGYTHHANRFTLGYGKQRQGLFCVGGVCRTVPASNGFTFSITSSF